MPVFSCVYAAAPSRVLLLLLLPFLLVAAPLGGASFTGIAEGGTSGGATGGALVTYCEGSGGGAAAAPSAELGGCQRKLVIDLTLDDSTVAGSVLETVVVVSTALHKAVFSKAEINAGATTTTTALSTTLQVTMPPIRIAFRRGGVQMRYRLSYIREFAAALRERVRALRMAMSCDDGVTRCPSYTPISPTSSSSSSSSSSDSGSVAVVTAPLGVCCLCITVECTLNGALCNESMRTYFCFRSAAAGTICVNEEGVRYAGWSISAGTPYYAMSTEVSGAGITAATYPLTTDSTDLERGTSRMQLLQTSGVNVAAAGQLLNVSQRVLFIPLSGERAAAGVAEWMLVPTSLVTASGKACDKVGVSAEHFYSLSSASQCNAQRGTCLANQLEDLRAADLAAVAQGGGGSYLAAYLGNFTQQSSGTQRYLLDEVERSGGATLRWSVNADALAFTPVPITGSLIAATYAVGAARVSVAVSNPNVFAGFYYVAVGNCSDSTRVIHCGGGDDDDDDDDATQECVASLLVRGLDGGVAAVVTADFQVWSATGVVSRAASCTVALRDAVNVTLDTARVEWTVETTTTTTTPPVTKAQRCQHCAFSDLRCLFSGVCEWQMLVWTVIALVVTWSPYSILAYWRAAWRLFKRFGCCRTPSSSH
ncbi:hypothetical protein N2W54_007401 [Lotmaria passim]